MDASNGIAGASVACRGAEWHDTVGNRRSRVLDGVYFRFYWGLERVLFFECGDNCASQMNIARQIFRSPALETHLGCVATIGRVGRGVGRHRSGGFGTTDFSFFFNENRKYTNIIFLDISVGKVTNLQFNNRHRFVPVLVKRINLCLLNINEPYFWT